LVIIFIMPDVFTNEKRSVYPNKIYPGK